MGKQRQQQSSSSSSTSSSSSYSLRSKAAHIVSDLTTVLLNPISDNHFSMPISPTLPSQDAAEPKRSERESISEESNGEPVEGPDTSSFSAFLYSLIAPSESESSSNISGSDEDQVDDEPAPDMRIKESSGNKGLLSRGKQSLGRAFYQAARFNGYRQAPSKSHSNTSTEVENSSMGFKDDGISMQNFNKFIPLDELPETSECSLLLSEKTRGALYVSFPVLIQGRKWVLLYSTWRHGISLSTLYRRSMLCPGPSLLVVGDRKGAIFGGLVEAPLRPTTKKRYQGTNNTFVFTNSTGRPVVFRPTGMNRYFTLCSTDYLALGGGSHFALYLDADLLIGSSSTSETYGNPCLARTKDFEVKEVELWGFVYASKYEEMVSMLRTEAAGICRW